VARRLLGLPRPGGVVVADFFLVRRRRLDVEGLYSDSPGGAYHYAGGFNPVAVAALVLGALPSVPGFLVALDALPRSAVPAAFLHVYSAAWLVGFGIAVAVYVLGMRGRAAGAGGEGAGGPAAAYA
jgi:NCS1 family nucleobase:cation symporter-1